MLPNIVIESGFITPGGSDRDSTTQMRTQGLIPCLPGEYYYLSLISSITGGVVSVFEYDSNGVWLRRKAASDPSVMNQVLSVQWRGSSDAYYYRFTIPLYIFNSLGFGPTSISIDLQCNHSEKERMDKDVETLLTVRGTLKDSASIIDPTIMVEYDIPSFNNINYMTIPSFNRSYFVNNITTIRNKLVEISAHVDVLSSFKDQIRQNTAIIHKQEFDWNLYLNDGTFKVFSNPIVETYEFPNGFTGTFQYVMAVAGGQSQSE